jgi:hypothetical protein
MIMADVNGDGFTDTVTQINTGVSGSSNAACISNGGGAVFYRMVLVHLPLQFV